MAESAVMILHGLRASSPVVTGTGCCHLLPDGADPDLRNHNLNRPPAACQLREPECRRPAVP
jgi:hypothetical protein